MDTFQFLLSKPKNVVTPQTFAKIAHEIEMLDAFMGLLKEANDKLKRKRTFKPFKKLAKLVKEVYSLQQEELMLQQMFSNDQLVEYKRDVRKLKESARDNFFLKVDRKFVDHLKSIKLELEPAMLGTGKKIVTQYCKTLKKKISKSLGKKELKVDKLDSLCRKVREYNTIRSIAEKGKHKKDEFEILLDSWQTNKTRINHLMILKESRVFKQKETGLIRQAESKLLAIENELVQKITEAIPTSGFLKNPKA
jgi:hypothetical protein